MKKGARQRKSLDAVAADLKNACVRSGGGRRRGKANLQSPFNLRMHSCPRGAETMALCGCGGRAIMHNLFISLG
jgi:hypothetical protein